MSSELQTLQQQHAHHAAIRARMAAAAKAQTGPRWGQIIVTRHDRFLQIAHDVAKAYGCTMHDLAHDRRYAIVRARYELYFRARMELGYTLTPLGKLLGNDHTTVLYGIRKIQKLLSEGWYLRTRPAFRG